MTAPPPDPYDNHGGWRSYVPQNEPWGYWWGVFAVLGVFCAVSRATQHDVGVTILFLVLSTANAWSYRKHVLIPNMTAAYKAAAARYDAERAHKETP